MCFLQTHDIMCLERETNSITLPQNINKSIVKDRVKIGSIRRNYSILNVNVANKFHKITWSCGSLKQFNIIFMPFSRILRIFTYFNVILT